MLPAIIAGGMALAGGVIGNRSRSKEAKKNRKFQERMSNTQWQRGVADMEAAGINPALAYGQGGASSPSGSLAQQEDVLSPSVSSAQQARRVEKELKLLDAQIRDVDASATQKGATTGLIGLQQGLTDTDIKVRSMQLELMGFDMVRARNMASAQSSGAGKQAALFSMWRNSIFGGGGAVSPLRIR